MNDRTVYPKSTPTFFKARCSNHSTVPPLLLLEKNRLLFNPFNPKYQNGILFSIVEDQSISVCGVERVNDLLTTGNIVPYESNAFETAEHGGTHLDAPAHFAEGTWRTQQIPMEKLIGPGVIINVKDKAEADPDYRVTVADLTNWEDKYGKIPDGAIVLMHSGWGEKYPNRNSIFTTSDPSDPSTFHFPGWHEDTTRWLITNRKIHVLGVDTPSNDYGQSTTFPTHVILGENYIPGVENVANLEQLPPNGTTVFVAVIKLQDGSGGPARVFATMNEVKSTDPNSAQFTMLSMSFILFLALSACVILWF